MLRRILSTRPIWPLSIGSYALIAGLLLSCASVAYAGDGPKIIAPDGQIALTQRVFDATALLYSQTLTGSYRFVCTATAFEKDGDTYRFISAAHCVGKDDTVKEKVELYPYDWFITFDDPKHKHFIPMKLVAVGYQSKGHDFAVLEGTIKKRKVPIVPLAENPAQMGENVINIAVPLGFGKQLFRGHVSLPRLRRPFIARGINWKNSILLQMSIDGGSSGSAIVSTRQEAIIGFLVGGPGFGSIIVIAIPTKKFVKFWKSSKEGTYKWYEPNEDEDEE